MRCSRPCKCLPNSSFRSALCGNLCHLLTSAWLTFSQMSTSAFSKALLVKLSSKQNAALLIYTFYLHHFSTIKHKMWQIKRSYLAIASYKFGLTNMVLIYICKKSYDPYTPNKKVNTIPNMRLDFPDAKNPWNFMSCQKIRSTYGWQNCLFENTVTICGRCIPLVRSIGNATRLDTSVCLKLINYFFL